MRKEWTGPSRWKIPTAQNSNETTVEARPGLSFRRRVDVRGSADWGHLQLAGTSAGPRSTPTWPREDHHGWGLNFTGGIKVIERDQALFRSPVARRSRTT